MQHGSLAEQNSMICANSVRQQRAVSQSLVHSGTQYADFSLTQASESFIVHANYEDTIFYFISRIFAYFVCLCYHIMW